MSRGRGCAVGLVPATSVSSASMVGRCCGFRDKRCFSVQQPRQQQQNQPKFSDAATYASLLWCLLQGYCLYYIYIYIYIYSVSKNAPTLASCSFDRHGLSLIIFSRQHQHTFENDVSVQRSLSLRFCVYFISF